MVSSLTRSKKEPKPHSSSHSLLPKLEFSEDVDLAVGLGSAVFSVDQILKATKSRRHRTSHYVKAGLASMLSAGAFAMMATHPDGDADAARPRTRSRHQRSPSPPPPLHRNRLRRSTSSPDLPRFGHRDDDDYEKDPRGYYSDDESETHHPHGRRPRLPYHDDERRDSDETDEEGKRKRTTKRRLKSASRRRHSFAVFEERDGHLSPGTGVGRRRSIHHRSPSPSPPRHRRHASVG